MIASLVFLNLAGCALLWPTDPYRTVSPEFRNPSPPAAPPPAETVSVTQAPGGLTLSEAVQIALEHNPQVAAAGHDAAAAHARTNTAWGAMLPVLSVDGSYTYHLDDQRLIPARSTGEPGTFGDSIFWGDLVLRMPLFAGGRLIQEFRAGKLLSQASEHRLGRSREELVFRVKSVFFSILAQEKLITSLAFSKEALASHLKRVNDLIAVQKAAEVDRLRTEVRLADVQQKIVREKNTLAVQRQMLANLMGIPFFHPSMEMQGTLDEIPAVSLTVEEGFTAAIEKRPDYLAARQELEAQARRVDVARAGHFPTVELFGAYGGRWAAHSTPQRDAGGQVLPTDDFEDVGRVGIGLEIPLFRGGRIHARVREEHARLSAAQARLRELELQIRLEVETALLNLASGSERVSTLHKSVEQAEESLRIERQKYVLGKGAIIDVLDAQAALLEAETNYHRALADVHIARAQIDLAMGEPRT